MNLIDLIQTDAEAAKSAVSDALQAKVFDYLDNYVLEDESVEELDEGLGDYLGRKLKIKTTNGKPDHSTAPSWATHVGKTHEGNYHWLEKKGPITNDKSDKYFPESGKSQFTGFSDKTSNAGSVEKIERKKTANESVEELDEAVVPGSVKKDAKGNVTTFKSVPDKKSAVVAGSVKKDNKGNVLSFKTEDYEVMDQEEFDAVVENFDQLDELSKDTLKSYLKKSDKEADELQDDWSNKQSKHGMDTKSLKPKAWRKARDEFHAEPNIASLRTKLLKRTVGGNAAYKKLSEESLDEMSKDEFDAVVEDFDQLDELSKATLGSYIKKANDRHGVNSISDHESEVRGAGVMTAAEKLTKGKAAGLQGLAMDARYAKSTGNKDAAGFKKTFDKRVDKLTKESADEFETIDENTDYIGEAFEDYEFNLAEERRSSVAFKFTHIPGDADSEKKLKELKDSVKGTSQRVLMKGRLGKDNPNAQKYKDDAAAAKKNGKTFGARAYQTIRKDDAKHFDIYVHNK